MEMPHYGGVQGDQSQGHIPTDDNKAFQVPVAGNTLDKQNEI